MSILRKCAQSIRHLPGLNRAEWLWAFLRKPYLWLLNSRGAGVSINVGLAAHVKMPAEFVGYNWEEFEPESVSALANWLRSNPNALVLDVGSSIGVFSLVALSSSEACQVVAFDSDLASILAAQRFCSYVKGNRLRLIRGFVSNESTLGTSLDTAVNSTKEDMQKTALDGKDLPTRYICLTQRSEETIQTYSLDDLFASPWTPQGPVLLKCDVEGAELLVLQGAERLLSEYSPTLLLSVHPPALPSYGHSVADVRQFLESHGYSVKLIATDHEEHWWCERNPRC